MLIEFIIAGIIIGIMRGGNVLRLVGSTFNRTIILVLSLLVYMSFFHFTIRGYDLVLDYIQLLHVAVYVILLITIILNYKYKESWIIFLGAVLNLINFISNGQRIIFSDKGLEYIGLKDSINLLTSTDIKILSPLTENINASVLSRFIAIPKPYPYPQIFSIGDLLMSIGIFLLIQNIMFNEDLRRNSMISFNYKSK